MKRIRYRHLIFLLFCWLPYLAIGKAELPSSTPDSFNETLSKLLKARQHPYLKGSYYTKNKKTISDLYFLSPSPLLWIDRHDRNANKISAAFQLIASAYDSGLQPEHYNLTQLQTVWQLLSAQPTVSFMSLALLDTAVTCSVLHLLSDLHFGRVNPKALAYNFHSNKNPSTFVSLILSAISQQQIEKLAETVEPKIPAYHQLKKILQDFRAKQTGYPPAKIEYRTSIRPEQSDPQIPEIRKRLKQLGFNINNIEGKNDFYDENLVKQIEAFQIRHGLNADGIIGKKTIKQLNVPLSERIQQIRLALERLRWLPSLAPGPAIMINIPAFNLWAYDSSLSTNKQALEMPVIVGQSKDWKSPVFTANMFYLEFSPYWNIPKSIIAEDILPKIAHNPLYLEQQNMELVAGFSPSEPALELTEDSIQNLAKGLLKLRQRPGENNALGRVKFIFPNNYNVYLHDTPSKRLFYRSKRDFSHGCIRVEKPVELVNFLLASKTGWNHKKTLKAMRLKQPKQIRLTRPIPVVIFYSTAFSLNGKVYFYDDIYDYDNKLILALKMHQEAENCLQCLNIVAGEVIKH